MSRETIRDLVRTVERSAPEEQFAVLCFLAGRGVPLEPDEANGALRRAELLLAAGGDPHRRLELYGRPVSSVASDLDTPARRDALQAGLLALTADVSGLRGASESLALLQADADLAWQAFAMTLLADELGDLDSGS